MTFRTTALIPAFNEAHSIALVIAGIRSHVELVLVIDDGSNDGTGELAAAAGAKVIRHERNLGKGYAVRAGIQALLPQDFTHVLLLDGDMQHLPQEAPRLLEAARRTQADLVIGERLFRRDQMPASRYYANRLGSSALSAFVGMRVGDSQCGYRVFRTDMLRCMRLRAKGYDVETEMLVKVRRLGGSIEHVPISAVYGGKSKLRPVRDTTRTCFLALYYRFIEQV